MIFSRRRGAAGRHAKAQEQVSIEDRRAARRAALLDEEPDEPQRDHVPTEQEELGGDGPYDISEAPQAPRLDLGSLLLPAVDDVEIRVQAGDNGVIQQVALVNGDNALQLAAFAAPRSDGIWDEVRAEIRKSLFDDGVGAEEVPGRWGVELRARLRTPEGLSDLRFVGIDGPRWMVRAVFQGPAAVDPEKAGPLTQCLTGLAVRRDDEARPVREPLPLRLPEQMAQEQAAAAAAAAAEAAMAEPEPRSALVPGRVPPPPAPTPFGSTASTSMNGSAPSAAVSEVPRRKPSPRPRRDG